MHEACTSAGETGQALGGELVGEYRAGQPQQAQEILRVKNSGWLGECHAGRSHVAAS